MAFKKTRDATLATCHGTPLWPDQKLNLLVSIDDVCVEGVVVDCAIEAYTGDAKRKIEN